MVGSPTHFQTVVLSTPTVIEKQDEYLVNMSSLELQRKGNMIVQAFPNPVSNGNLSLYIQSKDQVLLKNGKLELYSMQGKRLKVIENLELKNKNTLELNVLDIPSGSYILKIEFEGEYSYFKINID